jgi:hypothetical protein
MNWRAFYLDRIKFRQNMRDISAEYQLHLARLDTTKEMQKREGVSFQAAQSRVKQLIEVQGT